MITVEKNDGAAIMKYDGDFDGSSEAVEAFIRPGTPRFNDRMDDKTGVVPFVLYPVQSWKERWHDQLTRAWGLDGVSDAIIKTAYDNYLNGNAVAWSWSPDEHKTDNKHGAIYFWTMDEIRRHLDLNNEAFPLEILKIGWYGQSSSPWPDYETLDSILTAHLEMIDEYFDEAEREAEEYLEDDDEPTKVADGDNALRVTGPRIRVANHRSLEQGFRNDADDVARLTDVHDEIYRDKVCSQSDQHVCGFLGGTSLDDAIDYAEKIRDGARDSYVFIKGKDGDVRLLKTRTLDKWTADEWKDKVDAAWMAW